MRKLLLAGLTLIIGILFISRLFQLQVVNTYLPEAIRQQCDSRNFGLPRAGIHI